MKALIEICVKRSGVILEYVNQKRVKVFAVKEKTVKAFRFGCIIMAGWCDYYHGSLMLTQVSGRCLLWDLLRS